MNNTQVTTLCNTPEAEFAALARSYDLEVAGPSLQGSFLVKEPDGRAWLFGSSAYRKGLICVPSRWTELNLSYFEERPNA